jgi:hypothetical protein
MVTATEFASIARAAVLERAIINSRSQQCHVGGWLDSHLVVEGKPSI